MARMIVCGDGRRCLYSVTLIASSWLVTSARGLLSGGRLLSSSEVGCVLGSEQFIIHSELLVLAVLLCKSPAARDPAPEGAVRCPVEHPRSPSRRPALTPSA